MLSSVALGAPVIEIRVNKYRSKLVDKVPCRISTANANLDRVPTKQLVKLMNELSSEVAHSDPARYKLNLVLELGQLHKRQYWAVVVGSESVRMFCKIQQLLATTDAELIGNYTGDIEEENARLSRGS